MILIKYLHKKKYLKFLKPSFFIIGERKCATSSLFRYLVRHPNVLPGKLKEPNFFANKSLDILNDEIDAYWSIFPSKDGSRPVVFHWPELDEKGILYDEPISIPRSPEVKYITGEASANTFFEVEPEIIKHFLPNIKLIVLFRHPIDRAFSHHRMYERFQEEGRPLGFEVRDFKTDCEADMERIQKGGDGIYLSPSIYIDNYLKWKNIFKNNLKVIFSCDLYYPNRFKTTMQDILKYLKLPVFKYELGYYKKYNVAPAEAPPPEVRQQLLDFFAPYNAELKEYLPLPDYWNK